MDPELHFNCTITAQEYHAVSTPLPFIATKYLEMKKEEKNK